MSLCCKINVVQHPAKVLVWGFLIKFRFREVLFGFNQGEVRWQFAVAEIGSVKTLPLTRPAVKNIQMFADGILSTSLVGQLKMRFNHISYIAE